MMIKYTFGSALMNTILKIYATLFIIGILSIFVLYTGVILKYIVEFSIKTKILINKDFMLYITNCKTV